MMRHWNDIAGTLFKGEVYVPLLFENEDGMVHGNDWARGFMRGMRHDGWAELVNDEEHGGCLIPMMMLHHEHDEDPEVRPEPISPEMPEEIIVHMGGWASGAIGISGSIDGPIPARGSLGALFYLETSREGSIVQSKDFRVMRCSPTSFFDKSVKQ